MTGRLWTTNKTEYEKNPSLIYFHPNQYKNLKFVNRAKIYRCDYCRTIMGDYGKYNKFCDDWCKEMGSSKHLELCSQCYKCGINIPYQTKVCDSCKANKIYAKKNI